MCLRLIKVKIHYTLLCNQYISDRSKPKIHPDSYFEMSESRIVQARKGKDKDFILYIFEKNKFF